MYEADARISIQFHCSVCKKIAESLFFGFIYHLAKDYVILRHSSERCRRQDLSLFSVSASAVCGSGLLSTCIRSRAVYGFVIDIMHRGLDVSKNHRISPLPPPMVR